MKACKLINLLPCILVAWMSIAPSPIYASVTEYQSPDVDAKEYSADCNVIYKQTYDFSEDIPKYPEDLNISVSGYDGIYDEKPHGIMVSASTEGCKILYSEDGKNYSQTKPTYTDVGIYTTYYRVEINGAIVHEGHETIKISAADINYVAGDYNGTYDGKLHGIYMSVLSNGCKVLYSVDGVTFSLKKPEYKDSGTYVVYYKITGDNYKTVTGNNKIIIKDKNSESIIDYVTGDYNGVYDGKTHGIFVKAFTEGCEILYSEDGINYSLHNPEYTEPGTYVVYYKIVKDNYTTVTGSNKVIIRAKDSTINKDHNSNNDNSGNSSYNNSNNYMPNKNAGASNVQTGDGSNLFLYIVLIVVSVFGMTIWKRRGRRE